MTAHRYWRLWLYRNNGGTYHSLSEIQLRTSIGGADVTGTGTPTSSSQVDGSHGADKAFDNDTSTAWVSFSGVDNQWIKYDFGVGNEKDIVEMVLTSRDTNYATDTPKHISLQYSDDNSLWYERVSARDQTAWGDRESRTFNISNTYCDFAPHVMTGNNIPANFVISASSNYGGFPPYFAFDSIVNFGADKYWIANGSTGWVKIDLGTGYERALKAYAIAVNTIPEPNRAPKAWTVQGSNNDSDWDILDAQSNQTAWGSGEIRTFTLANPTNPYRYYKVNVTENNGDALLEIAELFLYSLSVAGTVCWGHDTGVTEANIRDFNVNWTGTGWISGSGNNEKINLHEGDSEESETWNIGNRRIKIQVDKYAYGTGGYLVKYKDGASQVACEADSWHNYISPFVCSGWVKVRVECN